RSAPVVVGGGDRNPHPGWIRYQKSRLSSKSSHRYPNSIIGVGKLRFGFKVNKRQIRGIYEIGNLSSHSHVYKSISIRKSRTRNWIPPTIEDTGKRLASIVGYTQKLHL